MGSTEVDPRDADRLELSWLLPEFVDDPHSFLNKLREEEPIRRVLYHGVPAWLVTRYTDVQAAFSESKLSPNLDNAPAEVRAVPWIAGLLSIGLAQGMINMDPPAHTRLRRLASSAFTSGRTEDLRPHAREVAEQLLDKCLREGRGDILGDFAIPMAIQVIMTLIGVPAKDGTQFQHSCDLILSTDPDDQARQPEALAWVTDYIGKLVAQKRATPGDDLLSALVAVHEEGDRLNEDELRSMIFLLMIAGFETTSCLIANGLKALLAHPNQLDALRARPEHIPAAVEEMLRYESSAMASVPLFALDDFTLGGVRIRRGETVIASVAAANRDPRRYAEPDEFNIWRDQGGHIGFAHGVHYCIGAPLARMEAQVAFAVLFERCAQIRLAVPAAELEWRITPLLRGLKTLPVLLSARD